MTPPRVREPARVCFPFAGGIVGGSHISTCGLIKALDRQRFTPHVVVHHAAGQVGELLRDESISFETTPAPWHFGRAPGAWQASSAVDLARAAWTQQRLARWLTSRRIDIVHTNEGAMHVTWALPSWLAGAKFIWHHRSSPDARGLRSLAPLFADQVVSVSHYALADFTARRRRTPAAVVYSPFDTSISADRSLSRARLLAELDLPPEATVIGYFGNFTARKRPLLFVDVIAEMVRRTPARPVVGVMFGDTLDDGLDDEVRQRAADLGVASQIRQMGFRYPGADWLAACDVLAVTAVGEPFGRTLIEAMLLGTAVVAVATGGNLEAIRDGVTGLLAKPDDAGSIAEKTLSLVDDPARLGRMTGAARIDALERFGTERHRADIEALYADVLTRPRQPNRSPSHGSMSIAVPTEEPAG